MGALAALARSAKSCDRRAEAQCHLVFVKLGLGVNGRADPWSARDALVPLFLSKNQVLATEEPARGPAADQGADQGVRPTNYAGVRAWEN